MDIDISMIGIRVMDEIVKPLREIDIDDTEFACLKAIVFFDPSESPHSYHFIINFLYLNDDLSLDPIFKI